jgi:membrane-bound lytic murein transglycosylase A
VIQKSRSPQTFQSRIEQQFDVYMSTGCDGLGTVLFTGYCEPVIPASLTRTERYTYPLYRLPDDLVKDEAGKTLGRRTPSGRIVPYYTRKTIDKRGVLEGKDLELAWVENPLDAYIIHVQGSATLRLPDGSKRKIGYAGKNGRPYASLGQALVEDGKIDATELSLENIRKHFAHAPQELQKYLFKNESYIFFTDSEGGPFGSIGARVTPLHTIATDKTVFPRASVTFIATDLPEKDREGIIRLKPYKGFALDQDTGGAIRSAGRVDVFLGTGKKAELLAGWTRCEGKLYYLFVREG